MSQRTQKRSRFLFFTSLAFLCLPLLASAQESELSQKEVAEYEERLAKGAELFSEEDYAGARKQLKRAYKIYPNPAILFSIAGTYRREGSDERAVKAYRRFLRECSEVVCKNENKQQIKIANETIEELSSAAEDSGAEEGDEVAEEDWEGEGEGKKRDAVASDAGRGWRWTGLGLTVAGVAALSFAGVDQLRVRSIESEIEDELARNGNTWTPALAAKEDDGQKLEKRARFVAIGGGAAAVLGVAFYLYGRSQRSSDALAVVPMSPSQGAGLVLSGAF